MNPYEDRRWVESYAPGVPREIDEPTETLSDMIDAAVARFDRSEALEFFGRTTSYRGLGEAISRAAEGLRRAGVKAGDRVALVLPNCPQHVVAFYAILRLGAIVVEHNPLYTPRELRHQFEDHGAQVAIVWNKLYDQISAFPEDIAVRRVFAVDLADALPLTKRLALRMPLPAARTARAALTAQPKARSVATWDDLVAGRRLRQEHPRPTLDDTAMIQYTSGTTGRPKGAILTHRNLRANAMQGRAWVPDLVEGAETFYGVLPFFHVYGMTLCLTFALSIGARLVLFPTFSPDLVLTAAKSSPPTFLPAVPPIYERLATDSRKRRIDLSSVRFAISGAMSLPVPIVELWEETTGGLLVEGYGMTETSPVALGNPIGPTRQPGTVGVPFPSTEMRVVDPEDPSVDRAHGEEGELLLRGPQVFQGYWRNRDATADALLPDGWLRTGDLVTVAGDGFVTISDRLKELIITGGFNVLPTEVETVLREHPDVADVAVVGIPHKRGGEVVTAAIVVAEGRELDPEVLTKHCRELLTPYKLPREFVAVDELPRSLIGKVLRREVRTAILAEHDENRE